ncbi:MAG: hypothetical protein WBG46_06045 [Nonlabens sp.]
MKNDTIKSKDELPYNPEITKEDKEMLRSDNKNFHSDGGDDRELQNRNEKVDFAGKDLDIPGREKAQRGNGITGINDEENKLHSQGGDRKTNLERDDAAK